MPHSTVPENSREASDRIRPQGTHYKQLPEFKPGDTFYQEWNLYRRETGRLLAQGMEGKFVLIKGAELVGIFDTWRAAREAGVKRYLLEPFFVHAIRVEEPYLRIKRFS
jgi:hypothetical protein